jgi:hypothetical protein
MASRKGFRRAQRQVEAAAAPLRRGGWSVHGLVRTGLPLAGLLAAVRAAGPMSSWWVREARVP